ncbi:hypothetical protein HPB48_003231 [Haemaphysalis longicornis]|uniref:Uncharacterized protein n=1 Tax=Haemaphysalis longicornis TaxID=44386 RepID=A0A9J6FZI9_HAELO|nr:hypothetical protein HPB48_003231 [Haemaphysalis longicornis]
MVKATKGAPYQIVERVVHQEVEVMLDSSPLASNVQFFCEQQLRIALTTKEHTTQTNNYLFFGTPPTALQKREETNTKKRAGGGD